ncbi:helix-turn-helix domain-containing protein [Streptomyces sp. NPDC003077]|uniref:helix-turn-helix domain-containing protein n=1 Tax=Streptomyces sp. NPDC003077 TaxID=3154443 RepID=UPI0033B26A16
MTTAPPDGENTPAAAGENIAVLRKARGLDQRKLARQTQISVSYLTKIETGLRPATPPVVAALAKALHVSTARIYGQPFLHPSEQADLLNDLRAAVRRHTLPQEDVPELAALHASLRNAAELRAETKYLELLRTLPALLGQVTAVALAADGDATAWGNVADVYGCAYAVAHRVGQPDLADMIVSRQQWAARQTWNPVAEVGAAWNLAGTFQSAGQYEEGLATIDQAIVQFERARTEGADRVLALGSLHLRGVVLASRHKDRNATIAHVEKAKALAEELPVSHDLLRHNLTFGKGNTALYELAAFVELEQPRRAVEMANPLLGRPPAGLKASRVGRLYIDTARAKLAVNDHVGAEEALNLAFSVAPQMAEIHPMSREVLRVLFVSHQRSKPDLLKMAKRSGLID